MIQKVIQYLNAKLELTNYFSSIYELSEIVKKSDGKSWPKAYCSNGEFKDLSNYDYSYGQSYWRKNGDVSLGIDNEIIGCSTSIIFRVPLKLVCFIPKDKLTEDDAYSDDRIAQTLIKQLTTNNNSLRGLLKAKRVTIFPARYVTNNQSILNSEYAGIKINDIDQKVSYLSIDCDIEITATKDCITAECPTLDSDILHIFDFCNQDVLDRLTGEQIECLTTAFGMPSTIKNSDETYSQVIQSNTTFTLPDIQVTQSNGDIVTTPSVKNIICSQFIDSLVKNSAGVLKYTLGNGDILLIPKHNVYKSNGITLYGSDEFDENRTIPAVLIHDNGTDTNADGGATYICTVIILAKVYHSNGAGLVATIANGGTYNIPTHNILKSDLTPYLSGIEFDANTTLAAFTLTYGGNVTTYDAGDSLTIPRIYAYPMHTGQTTSYATRDAAWVQANYFNAITTAGKLVKLAAGSITTLAENNVFGNTNRFTDTLGAQLYGVGNAAVANYKIDHYTGLGWYTLLTTVAEDWTAQISSSVSFSLNSWTDFFIPDRNQYNSIANFSLTSFLLASILPSTVVNLWTSSTQAATTTAAYEVQTSQTILMVAIAKTLTTRRTAYCRKHF